MSRKTNRRGKRLKKVISCYETVYEEPQRSVQTAQTFSVDVDTTEGMVRIVSVEAVASLNGAWSAFELQIKDMSDGCRSLSRAIFL